MEVNAVALMAQVSAKWQKRMYHTTTALSKTNTHTETIGTVTPKVIRHVEGTIERYTFFRQDTTYHMHPIYRYDVTALSTEPHA